MHVNTGLAQLSNVFMLAALVGYSLAVLAFAGDFAYGRRDRAGTGTAARDRAPALAATGVPAARGPAGGAGGGGLAGLAVTAVVGAVRPGGWPAT